MSTHAVGPTVQVVDGLSSAVASTLQDARKALSDFATGFLRSLLQPDVLRLRRLVIAEAGRFPALSERSRLRQFAYPVAQP